MEHPYLILTSLFGIFGMEEWAASHPHVVYMWLAMLILIVIGLLAGSNASMIPKKTQNVLEVIISGLEDFVVSITGEEGRKSFPLLVINIPSLLCSFTLTFLKVLNSEVPVR